MRVATAASGRKIESRILKAWALQLPVHSVLRAFILLEPDQIPIQVFVGRIDTYLRLANIESAFLAE
jgi:hypothetical protein